MTAADVAAGMDEAFTLARSSHRGPVFVDVPMDEFFSSSTGTVRLRRGHPHRARPRRRSRRRAAARRRRSVPS